MKINFKGHLLVGIIISSAFISFVYLAWGWTFGLIQPWSLYHLGLFLAVILISPLINDLDHESGKLHQWFIGVGLFGALVGLGLYGLQHFDIYDAGFIWFKLVVAGVLFASVTYFGAQFAKHRGRVHSLRFCIMYAVFIFLITNFQLALLSFIGSWSHLWADKIPFRI